MPGGPVSPLLRFFRKVAASGDVGQLSDGQLLQRFVSKRDEASFAALVHRHGAMVLRVCRQVLRESHDAEDAFQATFLVLVRRAGSVGRPELLGNWLYGVADRVAARARGGLVRRRAYERPVADLAAAPARETPADEVGPLVQEEVQRLPAKYRAPVVLCHLQGRTNEEAARQLGWPVGTVKVRLMRARELLRSRLVRRGLALSAGALALALSAEASVSAAVATSTAKAALSFAAGGAAAGMVSPRAVALTQEVLQAMLIDRVRTGAAVLLLAAVIATGAGVLAFTRGAEPKGPPPDAGPKPAAKEANKPRTDAEKLQGTWAAVSLESGAGKLPQEEVKKARLVFTGDKFSLTEAGPVTRATFRLDPGKTPKEIDLVVGDADALREVHAGIYQLDGDSLTICLAHPPDGRPSAFAVKQGARWPMLMAFKRSAAADEDRLQGAWEIVSIEVGGVADDKTKGGKVTFAGDKMTIQPAGKDAEPAVVFRLDPTRDPKAMDLTQMGQVWPAIYALDGDGLKICMEGQGKRPTEFATVAGRKMMLFVLKRAKD